MSINNYSKSEITMKFFTILCSLMIQLSTSSFAAVVDESTPIKTHLTSTKPPLSSADENIPNANSSALSWFETMHQKELDNRKAREQKALTRKKIIAY